MQGFFGLPDKRYQRRNGITSKIGREDAADKIDNAAEKLDWYHTEYLMKIEEPQKGAMLGSGINYIRFAVEEPNLFRFLFQSGFAVENNLLEMIDSPELVPVISAMQKAIGMNIEQTKKVFLTISLFAHGYASIIANLSLEYDEELI